MEAIVWVGKLIWFFLPAGVANMAPVLFKNTVPFLAVPVDNNIQLGGKPLFGNHKTWRGLIVGTLCGGLVFASQKYLSTVSDLFSTFPVYEYTNFPWWFGFLLGLFALLGDMFKSFFKRRFSISDGAMWFPFDQIDFVIGALLAISIFVYVDIATWLTVLGLAIFFHILINRIGFHMGLKDTPW